MLYSKNKQRGIHSLQPLPALAGILIEGDQRRGNDSLNKLQAVRADWDIESVVARHADMVLRLAMARCRNRSDAEDVFQEVFLRFVRSQHKITSEEHCRAWLIRCTINCSKTLFSSAWNRRTVPLDESIPFEDSHQSETYSAVLNLPAKYRTVIHLYYYEGFSIAEIAGLLHRNESTIKSQLSRARAMLRETLREEDSLAINL